MSDALHEFRAPGRVSLTGEFVDGDLERTFRQTTRGTAITRLRLVSALGAVFFVAGLFIDVHLVGTGPELVPFILARLLFASVAMTTFTVIPRIKSFLVLDTVVLLTLVLCSIATACIVAWSPGGMGAHSMTALGLVLVFYLFVPNRTLFSIIAGVFASGSFIWSAWTYLQPEGREIGAAFFYLLLANILGALTTRTFHLRWRTEYLNLLGERAANERLRREVEDRTRAEAKARDSEERFRRLVELSPDAIVVHRNGKVVYANAAAFDLVGRDERVRANDISFVDFVHPDYRQVVLERLTRMDESGENLPPIEIRLLGAEGREVDCEVVSGPTVMDGERAFQSVIRDISQRKIMERELRRLATTDDLTGAHNRRQYFELSRVELDRAKRYHRPICFLMMDLDRFKRINDSFGHQFGDRVLQGSVAQCQSMLRKQDIIGRVGGEEFAITMPETELPAGQAAAERLCAALAQLRVDDKEESFGFTVSIGVAECDLDDETLEDALKRADEALYAAKKAGRNRVCTG